MAEEKKKKRWGRAYLNDFRANVAGEYVYTGKHYIWKSDRKSALLRLWVFAAGGLVCAVVAGCLPATGMEGAVWALLPYVFGLIGSMTCVYAMVRLSAAGESVREYVFDATVKSLPGRCMMTIIFSVAAMIGDLCNIFLPSYSGRPMQSLLLFIFEGGLLAMTVLLRKSIKKLSWEIK